MSNGSNLVATAYNIRGVMDSTISPCPQGNPKAIDLLTSEQFPINPDVIVSDFEQAQDLQNKVIEKDPKTVKIIQPLCLPEKVTSATKGQHFKLSYASLADREKVLQLLIYICKDGESSDEELAAYLTLLIEITDAITLSPEDKRFLMQAI